jgi:hypothetical protein
MEGIMASFLKPEKRRSAVWGIVVTAALAGLIVLGSRNLNHFDAALVGYTFATLFATFGITYRYSMWLQRPPTRMYWRRGLQAFFTPRLVGRNLVEFARASSSSSPPTALSFAVGRCAGRPTG